MAIFCAIQKLVKYEARLHVLFQLQSRCPLQVLSANWRIRAFHYHRGYFRMRTLSISIFETANRSLLRSSYLLIVVRSTNRSLLQSSFQIVTFGATNTSLLRSYKIQTTHVVILRKSNIKPISFVQIRN